MCFYCLFCLQRYYYKTADEKSIKRIENQLMLGWAIWASYGCEQEQNEFVYIYGYCIGITLFTRALLGVWQNKCIYICFAYIKQIYLSANQIYLLLPINNIVQSSLSHHLERNKLPKLSIRHSGFYWTMMPVNQFSLVIIYRYPTDYCLQLFETSKR